MLPDAQAIERRTDIPFVGRSDELARLETAFEASMAGRACTLVTVVGPPGIGKSRLGVELTTRLEGRADVVVGRCLPYGEGITYSALGEVLVGKFPVLGRVIQPRQKTPALFGLG